MKNNQIVGKKSTIDEIRHHSRNVFQTLISYIGLMYAGRDNIDRKDVEKISQLVRGLSSLHDIYLSKINEAGMPDSVPLDQVIAGMVQIYQARGTIIVGALPQIGGTYRQAAALAIIMNELIDSSLRNGCQKIEIDVAQREGGGSSLRVVNWLPPSATGIKKIIDDAGLVLVQLLAKADLDSIPTISSEVGRIEVQLNWG